MKLLIDVARNGYSLRPENARWPADDLHQHLEAVGAIAGILSGWHFIRSLVDLEELE